MDALAFLAEATRNCIARRRDSLVGRQRRKFDVARQNEIDQLEKEYRVVNALAMRTGIDFATPSQIENIKHLLLG